MVLQRDNFWWEDRSCLAEQVQKKTVAPICQHDSAAASTTREPATTTQFNCPAGWQEFEGHCYLYSYFLSWDSAESQCVSYGGHLASVHSKSEQDFLSKLVGSSTSIVWLGGSDRIQEVQLLNQLICKNFFKNNYTFRRKSLIKM